MALRPDRLILDQKTSKVHYNGSSIGGQENVLKSRQKGVGTAGRKPLGDLSNSVNVPSPKQAPKKQKPNVLTVADKDTTTTTSKIPLHANKKKRARKALSDISNSIKPSVRETAEKNPNVKQSIVIEEEGFLHNHEECIKAQKLSMHMNQFLQMVGLDMDFSGQSAVPGKPPMSEPGTPPMADQSPVIKPRLSSKLASPSAARTPELPTPIWANHDISYRLIETLELASPSATGSPEPPSPTMTGSAISLWNTGTGKALIP